MTPYHKIQTVFLRDPETKFKTLLDGQFATPEFEVLAELQWRWEEKVDGTNIRIFWDAETESVSFGGKTDRADIPPFLLEELATMFPAEKMKSDLDGPCTLYGEGFGAKIQSGGKYISDGVSFCLFDVRAGDVWLRRTSVGAIGLALSAPVAPVVGYGTLKEAVEFTRNGFSSQWGDFPAEGLVMRPPVELADRLGHRVISKVKAKDFR